MFKKFLSLLLLSFVLISCKYDRYYLNNTHKIKKWKQHQKHLSQLINYQARGVILCSFCEKKIRLQFFVRKVNNDYQFILTDPLGFTIIELNISKKGNYFIRDNMKKNYFTYHNFENIINALINEHVLFNNFQDWIIGLPGTSSCFTLNSNGYLRQIDYQFKNNDFSVIYKNYYYEETPILPRNIQIYYNKKNYYFDIKIYKWVT